MQKPLRIAYGISLVFLVAVLWVGGSYLVSFIETPSSDQKEIPAFFITYIANSMFIVFLIPSKGSVAFKKIKVQFKIYYYKTKWKVRNLLGLSNNEQDQQFLLHGLTLERQHIRVETSPQNSQQLDNTTPNIQHSLSIFPELMSDRSGSTAHNDSQRISHKKALNAAQSLSLFYFLAQLFFNYSLKYTSVAANTIISSLSAFSTYFLSLWFLRDNYKSKDLFGVIMSFTGVVLVCLSELYNIYKVNPQDPNLQTDHSSTPLGIILCLLSALLYSMYSVMMKYSLGSQDNSMDLFFGYVGFTILVAGSPFALILFFVQKMYQKLTWSRLGLTLLKGGIDNVWAGYLWGKSIIILNPTIATVGLQVQTPISMVTDALFFKPAWTEHRLTQVFMVTGALLVIAAIYNLTFTYPLRPWMDLKPPQTLPQTQTPSTDRQNGRPPSTNMDTGSIYNTFDRYISFWGGVWDQKTPRPSEVSEQKQLLSSSRHSEGSLSQVRPSDNDQEEIDQEFLALKNDGDKLRLKEENQKSNGSTHRNGEIGGQNGSYQAIYNGLVKSNGDSEEKQSLLKGQKSQ